jgi:hypothetical protein
VRILVSAIQRVAKPSQSHGVFVEIDWDTKQIIRFLEAPPLYSELGRRNRGGRRGFRGITRFAGLVWAATSDALFGLDPDDLQVERMISHPWMSDIHEIEAASGGNGIWVASTGADGVLLVNLDQEVLDAAWFCGQPSADLRVRESRNDRKYHYHINTVFEKEGAVYCYALKTGEVFRVSPKPVERAIVLEKGCHNVLLTSKGWFRNQSCESRVLLGDRVLDLPRLGSSNEFTRPGWLRGMTGLPNGNVVVGTSPASLYEINLDSMEIADQMFLATDVRWTVHGVFADQGARIAVPNAHELQSTQHRLRRMMGSSSYFADFIRRSNNFITREFVGRLRQVERAKDFMRDRLGPDFARRLNRIFKIR